MSTALTPAKERRFQACVAQIQSGIRSAFDTGMALAEVRNDKLYLGRFKTFEDFCKEMFNISRQYAYRLIAAADLKDEMSPIGDIATESQARELAKVPEEKRAEVLKQVAASGPVTAKAIAAHQQVKEKEAKSEPKAPRTDCLNRTIPADVVPDWDRAVEVGNHLRSLISEVKVTVAKGIKERDLIFHEITNPTVSDAEALHHTLSQILPHVVCPTCQGRGRKACMTCRGSGWISKHLYNSPAVSKAVKAILEKGAGK